MTSKALICGLHGTALLVDERRFLAENRPWGVILFARNVDTVDQLNRLTNDVREALEDKSAPILIDQEGGRVQRIRSPNATDLPPAALYGHVYRSNPLLAVEAATLGARMMGLDLLACGINVNTIPVLDIATEEGHAVIGERAFSSDVEAVSTLGRAVADGLESVGVKPIMKHIPGHGRTLVDSHEELPVIDTDLDTLNRTDFAPFRMWSKRIHFAMTAHCIFTAVDADNPATQSRRTIDTIIRQRIGFHGALVTDDISMNALSGDVAERAEKALAAGCDLILHCNGEISEMRALAEIVPDVKGAARSRTQLAMKENKSVDLPPPEGLKSRFEAVIRQARAA